MGKVYESIDEKTSEFIGRRTMFFVATAPLQADGLVNLSPKGLDSFRILDPHTVAYLDLGGSGIETVAHVKENGRIVIMFCAFDGPPKIVRFYGRGEVMEAGSDGFAELAPLFPSMPGMRSIIRIDVTRISDSCGFGVPTMEFKEQRSQLTDYAENLGPEKLAKSMMEKNARSLDGLPGLTGAE